MHLDLVVGIEPQRVVEQDLGGPYMHLDRRRDMRRPGQRRCARVPAIVVAEVRTGTGFESRSRHQRILTGLARHALAREREIRPWGQQDAAAYARLILEQRQREAAPRRIADERNMSRVE